MKKLISFINEVNAKNIEGKDAEKNGTERRDGIKWGIDEPKNDAPLEKINPKELTKNKKRLYNKFRTKEPFFIQGKAGWGKTSIIKDFAERFHREVITVYLDKARAEELGGTPIPDKDKNDRAIIKEALPKFAEKMYQNPDQQFLLFFDEMNQAAPDVMNALMPIVLENEIAGVKFKNFFVGAAGNFESENDAVNELSDPLAQRFQPIIIWETGTDEEWADSIDFLHKKWDKKLSENFINQLAKCIKIFPSPRVVDHKICKFVYELRESLKEEGDEDWNDVDDYLERIVDCSRDDLKASDEAKQQKLAEYIYQFMRGNDKGAKESKKGEGMIPKEFLQEIKDAIESGYVAAPDEKTGKIVKYGISRENIYDVVADEEVNREMLERAIKNLEISGVKFKFEKDADWKKAGLKQP